MIPADPDSPEDYIWSSAADHQKDYSGRLPCTGPRVPKGNVPTLIYLYQGTPDTVGQGATKQQRPLLPIVSRQ